MIDREQLLDELARVFARAAVDRLLAQDSATSKMATPIGPSHPTGAYSHKRRSKRRDDQYIEPVTPSSR